jgi:hypothetical protein
VFLKGGVPGPKKAPVLLRDAFLNRNKHVKEWSVKTYYDPSVEYQEETEDYQISPMQHRWLPFPTFVEQPGVKYPDVLVCKPRKIDPYERKFRHENECVRPEEDE